MELVVWTKVYREKFECEDNSEKEHLLILVKSGSFYLETCGYKCNVGEGEAAIFLPDKKFHREVIEPVTMYLFRFKTEKSLGQYPKITFKDKERISSSLRFLEQLDNGRYYNDFSWRKTLFNDIMMQYFLESSSDELYRGGDSLVEDAKKIFEQYLHEKTPLTETAEKLGISYVHFIRRFKQSTGITPSEYLSKIRLERAKEFLANTDMPIKDLAPRCGFESEYYFSNVFKKYTGMTPTAFRKKFIGV